jgi:hypothetical protein
VTWIVVDMNRSKGLSGGQSCYDEEVAWAEEIDELLMYDWGCEMARPALHAKKVMIPWQNDGVMRLWRGLRQQTRNRFAGVLILKFCRDEAVDIARFHLGTRRR